MKPIRYGQAVQVEADAGVDVTTDIRRDQNANEPATDQIARLQARIVELEAQLGAAHRELVTLRPITGPPVSLFGLGRGRTSPRTNRPE